MADQNTKRDKTPSGFFGKIQEMMSNAMSDKDGWCSACAEKMMRMMPDCCSTKQEDNKPGQENDQTAPR